MKPKIIKIDCSALKELFGDDVKIIFSSMEGGDSNEISDSE